MLGILALLLPYSIVFLFGLLAGSFLNSLIWRLRTGEGIFFSKGKGVLRSYCPRCGHRLSWQDLLPILSYLFLRGRCRYCKQPISPQYPLVELATGLLFVGLFNLQLSFSDGSIFLQGMEIFLLWFWHLLYWFFLAGALIVIFVYDLKHFLIPDKVLYPVVLLALLNRLLESVIPRYWTMFGVNGFEFGIGAPMPLALGRALNGLSDLVLDLNKLATPLLVAFLASAFFLAIVLISRGRWMGLGDVKFAFFMGLVLGFPKILVALFLAFLLGAAVGIALVAAKRKTMKSEVPFGPFLVTGTLLALFWGQRMIDWYWGLFA